VIRQLGKAALLLLTPLLWPWPSTAAEPPEPTFVATRSYEIDFSTVGAVPVRWDVTDRNFVQEPQSLIDPEWV